jgi:hypothetical protein
MNERERFFQSVIARTVERIGVMSEAEVIDELRAVKAMRDSRGETLAFLTSISLVPTDSDDEINGLRSELSSAAQPSDVASLLSNYIEDALKEQLETLRKRGK